MTALETLPLFTPSDQVARCLIAKKEDILKQWDHAARRELEPARHQSKPALYDELPEFMKYIAKGLEEEHESSQTKSKKTTKATSHGTERAKVPEYTLEQMLFEYHLLRDVVFESLEEEVRMSPKDRSYIHGSIDQAMRYAAQRFSDIRIAEEQMGVARLEMERDLRERFVATLTHDLRTPLSAISVSAQLILRLPNLPDHCLRLGTRILSNVDRADRMIQDLLDANLIQAGGKLPLIIEASELDAIVKQSIEEIATIHGERVTLKCEAPIQGFWCRAGLRRSIENLIQNAIKYGDSHEKVTITLSKNATHATIAVHNHGNPIPPEEQGSLFQQFRRSDSAQASGKKGWGLGLTLVRGVTEAHGGTVTVESSAEAGTTFTMTLPLDAREKKTGTT